MGTANADDAGVYRISDELALVLTVDFFTPIVDDPYTFGAIAAANALSDVYAMGGRPVAALNVAMFPSDAEFFPVLKQVMQGGIDKMAEAGVSIIGGHTIRDKEPKFGYSVTGFIHPERIYGNSGARPGDALVITKKIGTGIISTGIKAGVCGPGAIEEFTESMLALNKRASEIMVETGVSTATDITGFGLIGHMHEVLLASGCEARVYSSRVPCFPEAVRLADMNVVPGGTLSNLKTYSPYVKWDDLPDTARLLLNDTQTSGGLLVFVPEDRKERLVSAMLAEGIPAAHIGDVIRRGSDGGVRIMVER